MINLLPQEIKRKNFSDYRVRAISIGFFNFSFVVLLSCVILFPVYFISSLGEKTEKQKLFLFEQKPESTESGKLADTIKSTNSKLSVFSVSEDKALARNVIDPILSIDRSGITINEFLLNNTVENEKEVFSGEIHGIAKSREELLNFSSLLEQNEAFLSVDSPISQYAKGKDIDYSISFTLNPEK